MNWWAKAAIPGALLVLHNAQRLAPVPLFDELRLRFATDYVGVGNLFGAYLLTYAVSSIPAGILADRMDNKYLLTIGAALSLLASGAFAVAEDYPIALASRLILGISGALIYVPSVRYVVTSFPKEKRASAMGVVEVGAGVGMILSLTLLPLLAREFDLLKAFLMLPALAALVLGGVLLGLSREQPRGRASFRTRLITLGSNRSLWYLLAYFFLGMLAHYSVLGWLPTFLRTNFGYSAIQAGLISTLVTLALVVGSPFAGILSDRLGTRTLILLCGSGMSVVSFILFLASQDPKVVIGAALLTGISMAFTIPVLMILVGEMSEPAGAGLAVSVAATTGQIASSFSGFVFGYALQTSHSFAVVWGLALIIAAGGIPFLFGAMKKIRVRSDSFEHLIKKS
jgi:NNP family nitrate/nitrite transporter-like MFS transporter